MTGLMETFRAEFKAITDHEPFPWQERLFERLRAGDIPAACDIPTGLGKTASMVVWLLALARGGLDAQPRLPRRLVYVVDRRAVVDQATEVAEKLRERLHGMRDVRVALGLGEDEGLRISTLRGQFVDNREWLEDPAVPAIIVGTVDMIGSRLLFEGYGVSRKMRPYHAGLLGADSLFVLDEAHLVPPFEHLVRSVATDPAVLPLDDCRECVPALRVLALSATGRRKIDDSLELTEKDFEHPVVEKRLSAKKSLRIGPLPETEDLAESLAKHAWELAENGRKAHRILVYCDSREVVRKTQKAVEQLARGDRRAGKAAVPIETELLVGARRVFERGQARERLASLGFIAEAASQPSKPVFLFATSAGEVGIDLDADHMVCDLVPWERMVQRLGRVNRRGAGDARVIVLVEPEPKPSRKEQEAIEKLRGGTQLDDDERKHRDRYEARLRDWQNRRKPFDKLRRKEDGSIDGSPRALHELKVRASADQALQQVLRDAITPEPLRPALTRSLVEAWAMTSLEEHGGRPAVEPWLRGWLEDDPPTTSVVWRTHLPSGSKVQNRARRILRRSSKPHRGTRARSSRRKRSGCSIGSGLGWRSCGNRRQHTTRWWRRALFASTTSWRFFWTPMDACEVVSPSPTCAHGSKGKRTNWCDSLLRARWCWMPAWAD